MADLQDITLENIKLKTENHDLKNELHAERQRNDNLLKNKHAQAETIVAAMEENEILRRRIGEQFAELEKLRLAAARGSQNTVAAPDSKLGSQKGGDHYKKLGIYQPWVVLSKWMKPDELKGFMKGTVIAYLAREEDKGGDLDIEKAYHTIGLYSELKAEAEKE